MFEKGEKDWNNSVNALLVKEGLASVRQSEEFEDVPEEVNEWY
jgi:hypothetical protein